MVCVCHKRRGKVCSRLQYNNHSSVNLVEDWHCCCSQDFHCYQTLNLQKAVSNPSHKPLCSQVAAPGLTLSGIYLGLLNRSARCSFLFKTRRREKERMNHLQKVMRSRGILNHAVEMPISSHWWHRKSRATVILEASSGENTWLR